MDDVTLNNGVNMPQLGLGVYQIANDELPKIISEALNVGYRSFDTAQIYENEHGVGEAIKQSNIPREELFVTTKVWNSHQGYNETLQAFEDSLNRLNVNYIDLYLIHWPMPKFDQYVETYNALEHLYRQGKVRAIGVSNFHIEHLQRLLNACDIKPVVNQVECHPYFQQNELKQFCQKHNIFIEAWRPLDRRGDIFQEQIIQQLAKKYKKTPAQIILRWHLQENTIVIPKTETLSRLKENIDVFDFSLNDEEMEQMRALNQDKRRGHNPNDMHEL